MIYMNCIKFVIIPSLVLFAGIPSFSQTEMVANGNFETIAYKRAKGWVNIGSVDYYQNLKDGTLYSEIKQPQTIFGERYIGLGSFDGATEVLIARLNNPMQKDNWYKISCYVLRQSSKFTPPATEIAIYMSDTLIKSDLWYGFAGEVPFLSLLNKNKSLLDKAQWEYVSYNYFSLGGERFICIGNFNGANKEQIEKFTFPHKREKRKDELFFNYYYYYDSISVVAAAPPVGSKLIVSDLTFKKNEDKIISNNDETLNVLIKYLREYPDINIEVCGYTDNDGDQIFNMKLSERRSLAVKAWLCQRGIEAQRIKTMGFGENTPIDSNSTEAGKLKNRRVEIIIQ